MKRRIGELELNSDVGFQEMAITAGFLRYYASVHFDFPKDSIGRASGTYWKFCIFEKGRKMSKNTSISLGEHFDEYVQTQVSGDRYKDASEVTRAGLRLLEKEECKVIALKNALLDGLQSPRIENFDFDEHLAKLRS